MSMSSRLSDEIGKIVHRKRRAFRFTQSDLGARIGVSGSYISGIENGKTSPRIEEIEGLATHFRTSAIEMIQEAASAGDSYIPAASLQTGGPGLDAIAADLSPDGVRLARDLLLFVRQREVDQAADSSTSEGARSASD